MAPSSSSSSSPFSTSPFSASPFSASVSNSMGHNGKSKSCLGQGQGYGEGHTEGQRQGYGVPVAPEDGFQISVGRLMHTMVRRDASSFQAELFEARQQTMGLLSAASMESYTRSYPFLTRLHILQEIELGSQLLALTPSLPLSSSPLTHRDDSFSPHSVAVRPLQSIHGLYWDQRLDLMSPSFRDRSAALAVRRCILGQCVWRNMLIKFMRCVRHFLPHSSP